MPKKVIVTGNLAPGDVPLSPCTRFGNLVFVASTVGVSHLTGQIGRDVAEQTRFSLERIKYLLEQAGSSIDQVLSATCFLADANDFVAYNEVYREFFPAGYPARMTVTTGFMRGDFLVEIMCTAGIADASNKKEIIAGNLPPEDVPLSPATRFGNTVFVSGTLGVNYLTGEVGKGIAEQTRFALNSIKHLLQEAGTSMDNVLTANCFLKTREDFLVFNDVWQEYFQADYPGRATLESGFMGEEFLVEIMCTACIPDDTSQREILRFKTPPARSQYGPGVPLPISPATRIGDIIYVSGSTGINHRTGATGEGVAEQTRFVLDRFKQLLEDNGVSMDNVLSVTCFLADRNDFSAFRPTASSSRPTTLPGLRWRRLLSIHGSSSRS